MATQNPFAPRPRPAPCRRVLRVLAIAAATPALALGEGETGASPVFIGAAGIFCPFEPGTHLDAPGTIEGAIMEIDQSMTPDIATTRVPARLGFAFGIRVHARPASAAPDVHIRVEHPPLGPDGITIQTWPTEVTAAEPALDLFIFEHPYEVQTGIWTFRVMQDGTPLVSQSFRVVPAADAQDIIDACADPALIS